MKLEWIKLGLGSMAVMERNNKIFIRRGTKVLGYHPQFVEYVGDLRIMGADYHALNLDLENNLKFDTLRFLKHINSDYRLIYIDNPNNPTGQFIPLDEITAIVEEASRKDVIVLVDEAYADCIDKKHSAISLINTYQNVIVTRSFTKAYGLAGIRVGYGIYAGKLSGYYDKVDTLLAIPAVASQMAQEAIQDSDFISKLSERASVIKRKMINGLKKKGYIVPATSEGTPIFIFGHKDEHFDLAKYLENQRIITASADKTGYLGKNFARAHVTVRAEEFLERL